MSKVIIEETSLQDIADSIRAKNGSNSLYKPGEMSEAIDNIPSGGADLSEYFENESPSSLTTSTAGAWIQLVKKIPKFELAEGLTSMANFFQYCNAEEIDLSGLDTSNVTKMQSIFNDCTNLNNLDMSNMDLGKLNPTSSTERLNWFARCSNLTNVVFGTNLGKGFRNGTAHTSYLKVSFSACPTLSHDSLMSIINNLYDISSRNTQDLDLGEENKARLSAEELATATAKGWTIV